MKNFVQISALCCLHKTLERQMDYLSHTYAHLPAAFERMAQGSGPSDFSSVSRIRIVR